MSQREKAETDELRRIGDQMQSSLSRVLAALDEEAAQIPALGYETSMAIHEGYDAIQQWTDARRKSVV